ncbi:hypothetical protein [Rhizobium sp. NZLR1]|nr:hypothetical protein [Rhizobium sp. NZLR1]
MSPKLFLSYDSNSGPSQFGLGWSLSGASTISRINHTTFIDGRPGAIDFDDPSDGYTSDALALDGARLVIAPEGGPYLAKTIDDQTRVWRDGEGFVAKTKAGLTLYFGERPNSQVKTVGGKILTWSLSRIEDTFGNQIVFLYVQRDGDWGVDKVFWTVAKGAVDPAMLYDEGALRANSYAHLEVFYETNAQIYSAGFIGGEKITRSLLAKQISAFVGHAEFGRYEFEYDATDRFGAHRLKSIREVGADVGGERLEYPKTEFTYTEFDPHWNKSSSYELPSDFGSYRSLKSGYRLVDIDGDGDRDVLYSAYVGGYSFRRAFKQDAQQWLSSEGLAPPLDFSTDTDFTDPVFFFDSDGDKKQELYSSRLAGGKLQATAHIQDNDTWKEVKGREPPFIVIMDGRRLVKTSPTLWDTKSLLLAWDERGVLEAWHIDQDKWESVPVSGWPEATMPTDVFEGDFDCDGQNDLATLSVDRRTLRFLKKHATSVGDLELQQIAVYQASDEISITKQIMRTGCSSIAVAIPGSREISTVGLTSTGAAVVQQLPVTADQMDHMADILPLDVGGQGQQDIALLLADAVARPNISLFRFDKSTNDWS